MENEILQQILTKLSVIEQGQAEASSRLDSIEQGQAEANSRLDRVEQKVTKIEVILENETNKNIQLLCEGHAGLAEKLDGLPEKIVALQDSAQIHNIAIKELYRKTAK